MDIEALQAELNPCTPQQVRFALHQVGHHPLRGSEKSDSGVTGNGRVANGQPVAGVTIRHFGGRYNFRLTEVTGEIYSWDELSMSDSSFSGFVAAVRDILRTAPV